MEEISSLYFGKVTANFMFPDVRRLGISVMLPTLLFLLNLELCLSETNNMLCTCTSNDSMTASEPLSEILDWQRLQKTVHKGCRALNSLASKT